MKLDVHNTQNISVYITTAFQSVPKLLVTTLDYQIKDMRCCDKSNLPNAILITDPVTKTLCGYKGHVFSIQFMMALQ